MLKKVAASVLSGIMVMMNMHFGVNVQAEITNSNIVYVALDGRENATGSFDDPFNSIEKARDYLRENGSVTKENQGTIFIREGIYHINKSIALISEDSFVTYAAYGDEEVEISGVATLDEKKFKKLSEVNGEKYSSQLRIKAEVKDKVYVYDLGSENIPVGDIYKNGFNWTKKPLRPELVQKGELLKLAQYPDDGTYLGTENLGIARNGANPRNYFFDKSDDVKTYEEMLDMDAPVFYVKDLPETASVWAGGYPMYNPYSYVDGSMPEVNPLSDNTKYETDGWLTGYFANHYANDNLKMYSEKYYNNYYYIYCMYPSVYSENNSLKVEAINLLCEMDTEGEYYIDRYNGNNVLYYLPKNDSLENITLTSMDVPLVTINGAEGIRIENIKFTGTTSHGITLTDCESCEIKSCELYNISMDAIRIGNDNGMITCDPEYKTYGGGHNNLVTNCLIHDMGHGGVYLAGGDRKSLERGNNVVSNCEFYNFSRLATYTPAVYLEGVGNTAKENYIHDAPHMAIQMMGNDMLVTKNRIVNTCYNANDMAPIYIGRDWTWLGNEISSNYIENVRYSDATNFNFGIYMDDNASGVIIRNNIFKNIGGNGIYLNKGYGSYVADNIFIDSTGPYYRYLTAGDTSWARPIPNEKALKYRFYDMLRDKESAMASGDEEKDSTKGYWNTDENISYWIEHYNTLYNSLEGKAEFDLGKMYFPKEGDASEAVWLDANTLINQNHNTIRRNITVNTDDLWLKGGLYNEVNVSGAEEFDAMRYRADSAAALGINLETGKISSQSSLMNDANYGKEWIEKWNNNFSVENAGRSEKVDNAEADEVFSFGKAIFTGKRGIVSNGNLPITGNSPFTLTLTVTPGVNKASDGYGRGLVSWGKGTKNGAFFLYYNSDQEVFEYGFYGNDGETAPLFPMGEAYNVAVTYDSDILRFYVNDTLVSQRAIADVVIGEGTVTVGSDAYGQGKHFTGEIKNVKIYDYAKSAEELGIVEREHLTPLKHVYTNNVKITSDFWKTEIKRMTEKWLPHCIAQLESVDYGINAFRQTANKLNGQGYSTPDQLVFTDAYTYNTIEAMCLALTFDAEGDSELKAAQDFIRTKLNEWIPIVLSAQEEDGYINTNYTLRDKARWSEKTDHEGYVMGYFIEAAIALYELTDGEDTRLYDAAIKTADLWVDTIGPSPKKYWYDGHQEMEIAMMRLGRFVEEKDGEGSGDKYFELAQYLCDARGGGSDYDQSHLSATEQSEAVGHSVRAVYQYTGMTDIAMETGNDAYYAAIERLWDSTVNTKIYVTGGIGSLASNEGFTTPYTLPNKSYNESCASCGMMFWANRMNMAYHDAKFVDNLERQLYNVVLGAVNLEGNAYYYQNELDANWERYSWHVCPCCIGNVPRTIFSLVKWAYATEGDDLYVNMLFGSEVSLNVNGTDIGIIQDTNYPWEGYGKITINPEYDKRFKVKVRLPEFNESDLYTKAEEIEYVIKLNGEEITPETDKGYAVIEREWTKGDTIEIAFPMDIRVIRADAKVAADEGRVSLQRGPVIYNFEDVDNNTNNISSFILDPEGEKTIEWKEDLHEGVYVIKADGFKKQTAGEAETEIVAIPNYVRLNRGGRSIVWIAEDEAVASFEDEWTSGADFSCYDIEKCEKTAKYRYKITPHAVTDGLVAFTGSNVTPNAFNSFSMVVRLTPQGVFDARNYDTFTNTNTVRYEAGKSYIIDIETDIIKKVYSVWVTDEKGNKTLLADRFSYRNDAPGVNDISKVCVRGGSGVGAGLFSVAGFEVLESNDVIIKNYYEKDNTICFDVYAKGDGEYDIYVPMYKNGEMISLYHKEESILYGETKSVEVEKTACDYYKLMVWKKGEIMPKGVYISTDNEA